MPSRKAAAFPRRDSRMSPVPRPRRRAATRAWISCAWRGRILLAQGAVGGLWLLAGWQGNVAMLRAVAWPMLPLAVAAAGYSAFLFGQAEGRDFWQSPLLLPHLLVAAVAAGAAALLLVARAIGSGLGAPWGLR